MGNSDAGDRSFLLVAIGVSILFLAGWVAWLAPQPPCGPPGNTALAHTDRWVPWVFIAGEVIALTVAGLGLKRTLLSVMVVAIGVGALTVMAGGLIDFLIAAQAHCFA